MSDSSRSPPSGSAATGPVSGRASREAPRPVSDRLVTGILVKSGRAPYEFKPGGLPSFFITLQTERGERTLWGRGLERALAESRTQPRPGQMIGVRENGIDPMTFIVRERDADGSVRTVRRADTPRPHWIVERREFFSERVLAANLLRDPRASRHEVVRNHPDLLDAYLVLDTAQKVADTRIGDRVDRERFVALVRETLAGVVERGLKIPSPLANRVQTPPVQGAAALTRGEAEEPTR